LRYHKTNLKDDSLLQDMMKASNNKYWVVRKVRAAKDLNLINEIKNLNLLRFNFPSKSHELSGQPNT